VTFVIEHGESNLDDPSRSSGGPRSDVADERSATQLSAAVQELSVLRHQLAIVSDAQRLAGSHAQGLLGAATGEATSMATDLAELAEISGELDLRATRGRSILADLVVDLNGSAAAMEATTRAIEELSAVAGQIGGVADAIDKIASATRMLALNARVEAARAGAQGSGFAIVAGEVKDLAAQTAREASRIATMVKTIDGIASRARLAADSMGADASSIDLRRERAEGARTAFAEITTSAEALSERSARAASSSLRQSVQLSDVSDSVGGTVRAAVVVERSSAALSKWSDGMRSVATEVIASALTRAGTPAELIQCCTSASDTLGTLFDVPAEHIAHTLAIAETAAAERGRVTAADLDSLDGPMQANLRRFERALCGVTVTLARGSLADAPLHMHWWVRDRSGVSRHEAQLDPTNDAFYDYTRADWFVEPRRRGRTWYSDPYFDAGGADRDIITLSVPFEGAVAGVATADIAMEQMQQLLRPSLDRIGRPASWVTANRVVIASNDSQARIGGAAPGDPPSLNELPELDHRGMTTIGAWSVVRTPSLPWDLVVHDG
jgi:Methyl-accepting chemotaxis protein (MCP) signalling domain